MAINVKSPSDSTVRVQPDTPTIINKYENLIKIPIRNLIIWFAMLLHAISEQLLNLVNHQIIPASTTPDKPYTGPTYGKISNSTRQLIAGKIAHEKGYTGNTAWLYMAIVSLIDRKTNTLEIPLDDLSIETGLSHQAILTHTKLLEDIGVIQVDRKRASKKSNEINVYHLAGEGAEIALWNGTQKNIAASKPDSKILSQRVKNFEGKDSTNESKQQAAAAVKDEISTPEEIELSQRQQAAVNALKEVKISAKVARELAIQYSNELERLFATIKCAQVSKSIRNPGGFVRDELQHNKQDLSWAIVSNGWQTLNQYINSFLPKSPVDYEQSPTLEPVPVRSEEPELIPLPEADQVTQQQWQSACYQLKLQLDFTIYHSCLSDAQVIGRDHDGKFKIAVKNKYIRDMLQHKLYRNVKRVLSDVRGESTELIFIERELCTRK